MAARVRALVVDDEPPLVQVICGYLAREGFEVLSAGDGESAVALARERRPDVVVLDLMLPGIDGMEVSRQLRTFSDAYVIMLTARGDEVDKLVGLSVGADDYLTKPFSAREVRVDGRPVELTRTEFDVLDVLSAEPGVVWPRRRLLERVWGAGWYGDDHVIDVHVGNLRHKLGDDAARPRYVRTVRGVGFRMGTG